ncbi:hypothetical protein [Salipaludibacillus daqingensis]|uniref:hypothetical protein n=1 Tax=Salipaludibacillus daqingensis TaxID=3041001 RepID=UPI0024760B6E|nr:hypothetical protein [Salipaludibacillus daqingensis]
MKHTILISILIVNLILVTGCQNIDSVEKDLKDYLNTMYIPWTELYHELIDYYNMYHEAALNGDEEGMFEVNETYLQPQVSEMLSMIEKYESDIKTEEVGELNELLKQEIQFIHKAVEIEDEALRTFLENPEDHDENEIKEQLALRDEYYTQSDEQLVEFLSVIDTMVQEHGITITDSRGE